jgi:hypothetical protein
MATRSFNRGAAIRSARCTHCRDRCCGLFGDPLLLQMLVIPMLPAYFG